MGEMSGREWEDSKKKAPGKHRELLMGGEKIFHNDTAKHGRKLLAGRGWLTGDAGAST